MKNLKQIGGHARQGDVLLRRIKQSPDGLKPLGKTVAKGEVTGHHHSFSTAQCFGNTGPEVCVVEEPDTLTHQEHAPIEVPKGRYEVLHQVEDTTQEVRRVAD